MVSIVFSMCMCMHMCIVVFASMLLCMCGDSRLTSDVFFALFPPYILRQPEPRAYQLG